MFRCKHLSAALLLAMPLLGASAQAKIDLVTLPARDTTQVTIYKEEDLTLVRETRALTFRKGKNEIQFSWANTFIDPTSLQIRLLDKPQSFTLLDVSYPANSQNTLVWNIEAAEGGTGRVEITYFTSGVSWEANYTAIANDSETELRLEPDFTIRNNSGEDFVNAQTRLVVGEVNLTEKIRRLAEMGILQSNQMNEARRQVGRAMMRDEEADMAVSRFAAPAPAAAAEGMMTDAKEIVKAAVSEYRLYTIEGTENIDNTWGKQLPDPRIDAIPIKLSYEYNPNRYGAGVVKFYKFRNSKDEKLGADALPSGSWYVYSGDGRGGTRFEGSTQHKYIPVGEDAELNLGSDGRVQFEQKIMSQKRAEFDFDRDGNVQGYDIVTEYELELRNANGRVVPMKITLPMGLQDWELTDASDAFKRVDRETVEWETQIPANGKKTITYTHTLRTGSRDRTNRR